MIDSVRQAIAEKMSEAKRLTEAWAKDHPDEPMPEETRQRVEALLGEVEGLAKSLESAQRVLALDAALGESAGLKAAHLTWRAAAQDEGDFAVDPQDWREEKIGAVRLRYYVPIAVQQRGYKSAFEAYLRKGAGEIGPNDRKILQEGVDTAGGYLVPEDYQVAIIRKIAALAAVRPLARVITTGRDIVRWPKVAYGTDDIYTSGVRLTWTGEVPASSTAHRVTDPVFGVYNVPVNTAMASMPITNDLIEDEAFDILGLSSELLGEAFALGEDNAFVNGDGVAKPRGILADVGTADGPGVVLSGHASQLTADGLIDLSFALPAQYEANARWLMSKATAKEIRKLKDDNGNYLWPVIGREGNLGATPRELLGSPVVYDEFVPSVAANAYPVIYGDFSGYLIVDRVGISVQRLTELYAETNITLLLARRRVGGQLIEPWRLKAQKVAAS